MNAPAFLLAAGLGTRLRPLTLHRPKPLVPIAGVPMLDYAAALLLRHGLHQAVVNAHHLPEQVLAWAARAPLEVEVSVEAPDILGTGGGLRQARAALGPRVVVVNGDVLSDVDLSALLTALDDHALDAVMALRAREAEGAPGVVAADAAGRVVELRGRTSGAPSGRVDRSTHFTGVHALRAEVLDRLPPEGEACIVGDAYLALMAEGRLGARRHAGTWFDIGTPQTYWRANQLALAGRLALPLDPLARAAWAHDGRRARGGPEALDIGPGVRVEPPFWIGAGARLSAGCHVGPGSVIGEGAWVGPRARLSGVVVWEALSVPADAVLENAIVFDAGVIHLAEAPGEEGSP